MDSLAKLSGAVAETVNRRRFLKTMAGSALAGVLTIVAPELVVASETTRMITSKTRQHQHHPPHDPCKYYCYAQTGCPSCSRGVPVQLLQRMHEFVGLQRLPVG